MARILLVGMLLGCMLVTIEALPSRKPGTGLFRRVTRGQIKLPDKNNRDPDKYAPKDENLPINTDSIKDKPGNSKGDIQKASQPNQNTLASKETKQDRPLTASGQGEIEKVPGKGTGLFRQFARKKPKKVDPSKINGAHKGE